ncbi:hypothetical protein [Candidatus Albibeggiatoa sp. nov. BB20]|uniref:hypothetical protein n=1 Tax=Candidatus Albibeggiatoa sp. nov. BB20 TaxID=3162723 RepID=UPI0033658D92
MNPKSLASYFKKMAGVSQRYKEEIEKLDMTNPQIIKDFESIGLASKTYYNWLNGANPPRLEGLVLLAHYGCDIQYVITGVRSRNLTEIKASFDDVCLDDPKTLIRYIKEILSVIEDRID